jgi:hypothetical protein
MGFQLLFDAKHKVLLARFDGLVTPEVVQAMAAAARVFAEREGPCPAIADFSTVARFDLAPDFIRSFAQAPPVMVGHKRVLVAPADDVFGSLRMYEMHQSADGDEPIVVRSLARAYDILGIAGPDFQPVSQGGG